jgi:hypothetical protein
MGLLNETPDYASDHVIIANEFKTEGALKNKKIHGTQQN